MFPKGRCLDRSFSWYNVFINDLPDNVRSSVRFYADDCVLYRNICTPSDCLILRDDLDDLARLVAD